MAAAPGYRHDLHVYAEPSAIPKVVVPFLEDGLTAGDFVVVRTSDETWQTLASQLTSPAEVTVNPLADLESHPHQALWGLRQLLDEAGAADSRPARVWSDSRIARLPASDWVRAESVLNELFKSSALWALCSTEEAATRSGLIEGALRTHPTLAARDDSENPRYQPPREYLRAVDTMRAPDPIEATPPRCGRELTTVTDLASARADLEAVLEATELDADRKADLVHAVFEVSANALLHGGPTATFHIWLTAERFLCRVRDDGPGYDDPLTGYLPPQQWSSTPGQGLWIARQLCDMMTTTQEPEGFTVRLCADL